MKKIISLFLCMVFIFSLSACGSKEKEEEYERIALTKDNYSEYININTYITDYSFAISEQDTRSTEYNLSVVVHIETSKKVDCTFKNVSITYNPHTPSGWKTTYSTISPKTTLDFEGSSHISYAATYENRSSINALTTVKAVVLSIEGFVVVQKEK